MCPSASVCVSSGTRQRCGGLYIRTKVEACWTQPPGHMGGCDDNDLYRRVLVRIDQTSSVSLEKSLSIFSGKLDYD